MNGLTILIVDDNEDDQSLYRRALRGSGMRLVSATTAVEGLDKIAEIPPDVILLDFNLPDLSGLGFMERFAELEYTAIPVVMLTGEGNEAVAVSAMKAGVSDYLVKDVEGVYLRLLLSVIHRARNAHEERQRTARMGALQETILGTVADGIVGIDTEGKILFANPSSERMLLYPSGHLSGKSLSDFLRQQDPKEDWDGHPLSQPHDGSEIVSRDTDVFLRLGSTSFPVAYTASPLDFEGDGRFGWVLVFRDISERKQAEEELIRTARYDILTGLPNRLMFQDYFTRYLARGMRNAQHLALLFIDLDGFKAVNDTLGHLAGDQVLQTVAQRLVKCVRGGDLVSRFGGDEFTVILEDCEPDQLPMLARRILQELEIAIEIGGQTAQISASIGIAIHPECGTDEHTLLQKADAAMYMVKKGQKKGFALCPTLADLLTT